MCASLCLHALALVLVLMFTQSRQSTGGYEVTLVSAGQHFAGAGTNPEHAVKSPPLIQQPLQSKAVVQPFDSVQERASISSLPAGNAELQASAGNAPASQQAVQRKGDHRGPSVSTAEFGTAEGPGFLEQAMLRYPVKARLGGRQGKVLLRLHLDEHGRLQHIEVVEDPGHGFAAAAIDAVKRSTFRPARKDGQNVAARALLPVRFMLTGKEDR